MSKTISTILSMRDNMSGGIMRVSRNVEGMTSQMRRASQQSATFANNARKNFEKVGDKAVKLGAAMAVLATGFIIKVGFEGMKELDAAAAKVKSIAMDTLEKKDIKVGLLKTSSDTGISTTELGDTQYNAISSGVKSKDSLAAAVISAKLAKAGFTDSNSALKVLMATMNVYGLTGSAAMQKISDKMLVVQNLGVITVAEMAETMGSVTPIAQASGASIDELDAGMIALTKNGIKAEEASVELKGIFTSIIKPSSEAADTASALGLNFSAAGLKAKGFSKFMAEVRQKTGGSTEKMAKLFGNVRALTGAIVLSGVGFKDFNSGLVAVKESSGMTDTAFKIMADTLGGRIAKLKNRVNNIATSIMDNTSGSLNKMVSKITAKLTELEKDGSIQKFVDKAIEIIGKLFEVISKVFSFLVENRAIIEGIALAFASFYVAIKIMKVLKGVMLGVQIAMALLNGTLVVSPFGWAVLAIGLLIAAGVLLWKNWDVVKVKLDDFCFGLKNAFSNIGTFVANVFKGMANDFIDSINKMITLINKLPGVQINAIAKYDMGDYASLTRPEGTSASRSYDAMANAKKTSSTGSAIKAAHSVKQYARGTSYARAGLSLVGEEGPELLNLKGGSSVTTADKTSKMLGGISITKIADTIIVREDADIDKIATAIVRKISAAAINLG